MKTLLVVLGFGLALTQANAQKLAVGDVPEHLKNSLEKNFGIRDADWDQEGENYEANFEDRGKEMSVLFDPAGSVLETEREIARGKLPKAVIAVLRHDYPDFQLEESAVIEENGVVTYETEVENAGQTFDLIFDADGKLIKKEVKEG